MTHSNLEFSGKTVLISGGTKGLGFSTACLFAKNGADVFLSYRSDEVRALHAAEEIRTLGARCELVNCDLSEEGSVDQLFDQVAAKTPKLDIYVHNAAATAFKNLLELKSHHIDKTLNMTIKGFILGVQRAVALMPQGGWVVTVSGMDTLKAVPRHGLLGGAKAALETLTAYYAHELAPRKIRVNGVNPGYLDTESTRKYLGPTFETVKNFFAQQGPLKRTPSLDEVSEVILFLCSERSSWIVGQTLNVDGGLDFSMTAPSV
ncbi:SDR family oxidoreductase [Bdellovibrionota bacterium FG-2]